MGGGIRFIAEKKGDLSASRNDILVFPEKYSRKIIIEDIFPGIKH